MCGQRESEFLYAARCEQTGGNVRGKSDGALRSRIRALQAALRLGDEANVRVHLRAIGRRAGRLNVAGQGNTRGNTTNKP